MRIIDADKLTEVIIRVKLNSKGAPNFATAEVIDAVEVVRCKDCKDIFFDDWYKCFSCANLYGLNEEVKPDDFCSHGERKESE